MVQVILLIALAAGPASRPATTRPAITGKALERQSEIISELNAMQKGLAAVRRGTIGRKAPAITYFSGDTRALPAGKWATFESREEKQSKIDELLQDIKLLRDELIQIRRGTWSPPLPPKPLTEAEKKEAQYQERLSRAKERGEPWVGMTLKEAESIYGQGILSRESDIGGKTFYWLLNCNPDRSCLKLTASFQDGVLVRFDRMAWDVRW
jgi:hypothetical protein